MNELKVFKNSEFGEIGVLLINGKEFFPATACAKILGYVNPHKAINDHCKGVTKREGVSRTTNQYGITTEQKVTTNYIPEGDLYRLIIRSKLPAAEKFERWVFDEVLPAIRKQGHYSSTDQLPLDKVMEIVRITATAMVAELVKQIIPLICNQQQPFSKSGEAMEIASYSNNSNRCKLESFPQQLRQQVDDLIDEMLEEQSLNFSRISRYCTLKGYPISSPSVKRYFDRRLEGGL